jgi:hypothetical protein
MAAEPATGFTPATAADFGPQTAHLYSTPNDPAAILDGLPLVRMHKAEGGFGLPVDAPQVATGKLERAEQELARLTSLLEIRTARRNAASQVEHSVTDWLMHGGTGAPPVTNIRNRRAATARCGFTMMPDGLVNTIAAT